MMKWYADGLGVGFMTGIWECVEDAIWFIYHGYCMYHLSMTTSYYILYKYSELMRTIDGVGV